MTIVITRKLIEELIKTYVTAANTGDWETVANLFHRHANITMTTATWVGARSIRDGLKYELSRPGRTETETEIEHIDYDKSGKAAVVTETFTHGSNSGKAIMHLRLIDDRLWIMAEIVVENT